MTHQENSSKGENNIPASSDQPANHSGHATIQNEHPKKKRSGKVGWIFFIVLMVVGAWFGYKLLNPSVSGPGLNPLNLVPKSALFVLETDKPYTVWSQLSETKLWEILQKDGELKEYGAQLSEVENTLSGFDQALDLFTNRTVYLSGHLYRNGRLGYLFVLDLGGIAALSTWMSRTENVTTRMFQGHTIYEKFEPDSKETLYFTFVGDLLVASYVHVLVEASIQEKEQAVLSRSLDLIDIQKKVVGDGLIRMYLNYDVFYSFLGQSINKKQAESLNQELPFLFSGFYFDVKDEFMAMEGYSNFDEQTPTYLSLFSSVGTGEMDVAEIAPDNTSVLFSLGFDSFTAFYENLSAQLSADPDIGKEYQLYTQKTEKFLDIDLKADFADWIDDEIAVIQMESGTASSGLALVFKGKSRALVEKKMSFLSSQIKRKTPVRFKAVDYKGYSINYMSVKGFFNLVLGVLFKRFDRPYYTIIDEYVVFSNEPQVLRNIIDARETKNTLSNLPSFKDFQDEIGENHSAMIYLQLELLEKSHGGLIDDEVVELIQSKNSLLAHFPQVGFKISPSGNMFKTQLLLSMNSLDPALLVHNDYPAPSKVNYDSIWQVDPGEAIVIDEIEIVDLGAKKQSETYEGGSPKYEVELKDGLRHGDYFEYHTTGELKVKGKYRADLKEGTWKYYDIGGKLTKKEKYKKGVLVR